jgi:hypothetical protein
LLLKLFPYFLNTIEPVYIATQGKLKMWPLWAIGLYIQVKIISINGENKTFIDSDLLYRGALYRQWFVI